MAKASREKPTKVEIQRGPIRMEEQYTSKFKSEFQRVVDDADDRALRRSGQTLTLHEPKR